MNVSNDKKPVVTPYVAQKKTQQVGGDSDLQVQFETAIADRDSLQARLDESDSALAKVKAEYADFVQSSDRTSRQYQKERDDLQVKLTEMESRANDLQKQLDKAKIIPGNAAELIASVKGISDDMAQKALTALTSGKPDSGK